MRKMIISIFLLHGTPMIYEGWILNFLTVPCALEIKLTIIKHITGNWKFDSGVILGPDKLSTKSFTKYWDTLNKHCPAKFIHTCYNSLCQIWIMFSLWTILHNSQY